MSTTDQAGRPLSREELLTAQFYEWEIRGRGWQIWGEPVELEPPFRPFLYHSVPRTGRADDARKPTFLSSFVDKYRKRPANENVPIEKVVEPEPRRDESSTPSIEFRLSVPPTLKISTEVTELFFFSLDLCEGPVSFEVLAQSSVISIQFACRESDADHVRNQLSAYFPEVTVLERPSALEGIWEANSDRESAVIDLGLANEFMLPLGLPRNLDLDPLIGVIGALSSVRTEEVGLLQVLFTPVRNSWVPSVSRSVTDYEGNSFFADAPEILKGAQEKVSRPLYAASVRIAARSPRDDRVSEMLRKLKASFSQFSNPIGNEFVPLSNDGYSDTDHIEDIFFRRSHRSGMILNSEELACLAHLPSVAVRSPKLERTGERTKASPNIAANAGLVIGENLHAWQSTTVALTPTQRIRHTYVLGASGTGKSTFLLNCILQDLKAGEGIGVLDPHGDLIDQILEHIPEERVKDVVLLDPSDEEYPVGFNILSAHSELEKTLLSSDLVSVFQRLSTSWGDQMTSVLGNAVLAFLESERGGTLIELRRFLVEADFRSEFLKTVTDPDVIYYWQKEYPLLAGRPQAPLLTRLDTFLRPKLIRRMVGQRENKIDFRNIMDGRKILLARPIGVHNAPTPTSPHPRSGLSQLAPLLEMPICIAALGAGSPHVHERAGVLPGKPIVLVE